MEVSLRPGGAGLGSLRPGGGGLLSTFAAGSRPKHTASASKEEKGYDEVIKYDRAFLLAFKEVRSAGRGGAADAWRRVFLLSSRGAFC